MSKMQVSDQDGEASIWNLEMSKVWVHICWRCMDSSDNTRKDLHAGGAQKGRDREAEMEREVEGKEGVSQERCKAMKN